MRGGLHMKKARIGVLIALLSLGTVGASQAAFTVGGENGWQLSTDGIVDIFATYYSTSKAPKNVGSYLDLLGGNPTAYDQRFGVGIGLLPSVIAFNIKAPTVNGVESTVRVGIYPNVQNESATRFDTSPNIDFREFFYTAKGAYGELLAGRALNLYQGKNILTDMTLLTAGTVPSNVLRGGTTLGHIGYGYLYTNFGPQFRYTTPDFGGAKVALAIAEPYNISADTAKTNSPRVEAEISYAKVFSGVSVQGWLSAMYQTAPRKEGVTIARSGKDNESIGGAYGLGTGFSGVNLLFSGYGGKGLGMVSAQDGDFLGSTSTDAAGKERLHWGFLAQATYQLTPSFKVGANYGQTRQEESDADAATRAATGTGTIKKQESGVLSLTYNLNKFTQFIGEYIYAQNTWHNGESQHSNQFALGTMFYW